MIYLQSTDTVHCTELIKTVGQEEKGSGSCSYIRDKKRSIDIRS